MAGASMIFYYGYLNDNKLQEKVVSFAKDFWKGADIIDVNVSDKKCFAMERLDGVEAWIRFMFQKSRPVNYFGFIPVKDKGLHEIFSDDSLETEDLIISGQFIFDRSWENRLVTFFTLPDVINVSKSHPWMNNKPIARYEDEIVITEDYKGNPIVFKELLHFREDNALAFREGGFCNLETVSFALLLYIIKIRWMPNLEVSGEGQIEEVTYYCQKWGLENKFLNERMNFDACQEIYFKKYAAMQCVRSGALHIVK